MITPDQRGHAWHAGIAAATDYLIHGARPRSPYGRYSRLHTIWQRAVDRTCAALRPIMETYP